MRTRIRRAVSIALLGMLAFALLLPLPFVALADDAPQPTALAGWTLPSGWESPSISESYTGFTYYHGDTFSSQGISVQVWRMTPDGTDAKAGRVLTSPSDFDARAQSLVLADSAQAPYGPTENVTIDTRPAWKISADTAWSAQTGRAEHFERIWVPQANNTGGVFIYAHSYFSVAPSSYDPTVANAAAKVAEQMDAFIATLKLRDMAEAPAGSTSTAAAAATPPAPAAALPWRTIGAGALAVAAAAAALAGAFLATPEGRRRAAADPNAVVGYLLQLSAPSLGVTRDKQAPFDVTVWRVRATGAAEAAPDARIVVSAPAGVAVTPDSGAGSLRAGAWQTGEIAAGAQLTITASTADGSTTSAILLHAAQPPSLDASPDSVSLEAGTGGTAQVDLAVLEPGEAAWHYAERWPEGTIPLARCAFAETSASTGQLTLTEDSAAALAAATGPAPVGTVNPPQRPKLSAKLTVVASADGQTPVERVIDVEVAREGLFAETLSLNADGTYHVRADGKKQPQTIVFRAYVRDPATGHIAASPAYVSSLKFELVDEPGSQPRASAEFSQLKIAYQPQASADEREPGGAYSFAFTREVPGKGEAVPVRYLVTAPGLDPDKFWCEIRLGLETTARDADSPEWQAEYQRALNIIQRLMPASYYPSWKATLDNRAQFLGHEGLAELRKRIWENAVNLVLAEGGQGYLAEANWANRITVSLEIFDVAGDIAFQYLCSRYLGPATGQAAQIVKPIITSAIGEYLAGTSADDWVAMQIGGLGGVLESRVVDVAAWERLAPGMKWKLWGIFVGYHFLKARLYQGKSLMDSLKIAAEAATGVVVFGWIQQQLHKYAKTTAYPVVQTPTPRPKPKPVIATTDVKTLSKPARPGRPVVPSGPAPRTIAPESAAAARIRTGMRVGPDGVPMADRADVLATMRDPLAVRDLKNAPPAVQAAFNNTRNQIYREHDAAVLRDLRSQPGMAGRRLAVVDVRTPGADPNSTNTDRDFRVIEIRRDPVTGAHEAIEVDRRRWEDSSARAFARSTGGPVDDPVAAREWSRAHQQNATDRFHEEAAPDLARQGYVEDPNTGEWRQAQVRPNIELVKEGQSTLHDPEALGKTYVTKVQGAIQAGHTGEAYVQAGKAVQTMTEVRAGYAKQGYQVGQLSHEMRQGMAIVGDVKDHYNDNATVGAADSLLRAAGFPGGLDGFMRSVSGHIESLKNAEKRS